MLHCLLELNNFDKALIISGDGDFHCLIEYLDGQNKLLGVGIPNKQRHSSLLRKFSQKFFFISDLRQKLQYKKEDEHPSRHKNLK